MELKKIHIVLFVLTLMTTFLTGFLPHGSVNEGITFSLAILFILGSHEMGHYYYGKKYLVSITPPYFIPAPPVISPIGTFGAFIRIGSRIPTKKALFDIGIAGPLAGIIATIPIIIIGLIYSSIVPVNITESEGVYQLGSPILFTIIEKAFFGNIPEGFILYLHPIAFAGWVGLFVTSLNLIPSGQLDGGHIVYSLFTKRFHKFISITMITLMIILGVGTKPILDPLISSGYLNSVNESLLFEGWLGWLLWAAILSIMGTKHPPTYYDEIGLDSKRILLGVFSLIIFIICFTPVPIKINM